MSLYALVANFHIIAKNTPTLIEAGVFTFILWVMII